MIAVGIVGGTGYTGVELLRLLLRHSQVQVRLLTSRTEAGKRVADMFPNLRGHTDLEFSDLDIEQLKQCDVVFFATPHGVAMAQAPDAMNNRLRTFKKARRPKRSTTPALNWAATKPAMQNEETIMAQLQPSGSIPSFADTISWGALMTPTCKGEKR